MKNSIKGALLSGLAFPGIGQISLKHYKRGIALILVTLAILIAFVAKVTQQAFVILEKIELERGAIDLNAISNAATQASNTSDSLILNFLLGLMIFFWIIGVVDAYRIGKKMDLEEQSMR